MCSCPVATGLGGAVVTLTSGSAQSFGTLFVDSQDDVPAVNGCTFRADVSSPLVASVASTVPILVVATEPGCSYQVVSTSAFVTAGGGGTGTGVLTVGVAANGGTARVGIVEIAGQPVGIRQASASDPTAPTGLAVVVAGTTVQLTWNPPPQGTPTSYVIEAGSTPGASNLAVVDTGSPATSLTAPVPPGTYFVRARARRGGFTGGASNEVIVDVTGACSAPGIPAAFVNPRRERCGRAVGVAARRQCDQLPARGRVQCGPEQSSRHQRRQRDGARRDRGAGHLLREDARREPVRHERALQRGRRRGGGLYPPPSPQRASPRR